MFFQTPSPLKASSLQNWPWGTIRIPTCRSSEMHACSLGLASTLPKFQNQFGSPNYVFTVQASSIFHTYTAMGQNPNNPRAYIQAVSFINCWVGFDPPLYFTYGSCLLTWSKYLQTTKIPSIQNNGYVNALFTCSIKTRKRRKMRNTWMCPKWSISKTHRLIKNSLKSFLKNWANLGYDIFEPRLPSWSSDLFLQSLRTNCILSLAFPLHFSWQWKAVKSAFWGELESQRMAKTC